MDGKKKSIRLPLSGIGSEENSFTQRAPSESSYNAYIKHLSSQDNKSTLQLQLQALLDWNKRILSNLDPKRGKAADPEAIRLIFYICDQLKVPDLVKLNAIEIFDRWVLAYDKDINSANLNGTMLAASGNQLKVDIIIRVCSCIQLASKVTGKITNVRKANQNNEIEYLGMFGYGWVTNYQLQTQLGRMGYSVSSKKLAASEMSIFRRVDYNVLCLTPLEIIEVLLMFTDVGSSEFRTMYGLCVQIIDYVYFFKKTIYSTLRNRLYHLFGRVKTDEEMLLLECNYILRAASIIQCAMFVLRPMAPRSILGILERYAKIASDEILILAICIASSLFGMT